MTRVNLTHPITVDGRTIHHVDVEWPERAGVLGLLGIADQYDQVARTIATLTGLPALAVYRMAIDDWQSIIDAWRAPGGNTQ